MRFPKAAAVLVDGTHAGSRRSPTAPPLPPDSLPTVARPFRPTGALSSRVLARRLADARRPWPIAPASKRRLVATLERAPALESERISESLLLEESDLCDDALTTAQPAEDEPVTVVWTDRSSGTRRVAAAGVIARPRPAPPTPISYRPALEADRLTDGELHFRIAMAMIVCIATVTVLTWTLFL